MLMVLGHYEGENICNLSKVCKTYKEAKKIMKFHYDANICNKFEIISYEEGDNL